MAVAMIKLHITVKTIDGSDEPATVISAATAEAMAASTAAALPSGPAIAFGNGLKIATMNALNAIEIRPAVMPYGSPAARCPEKISAAHDSVNANETIAVSAPTAMFFIYLTCRYPIVTSWPR